MKYSTKLKCTVAVLATLLIPQSVRSALVPVASDIATGTTITWHATNQYRLDTVIYVQTNATLIIEPGTVIKGATNVTVARPGIPELVSALWVTRGGKLIAEGTKENPIIFTAEGDNLNGNIPPTQSSLWGGVVLMGNAVINSAKDTAGNVASPKYDVFEGVTGAGANNEHRFGGNNDADTSGSLRYVSIRHAGRIFAPAAELNCLTLAGVGFGTKLEYIEVFAGSDDGVEWWGGTAGANYVVAAFIEDDDFDTDQGYRGTNQFWFGIKPPWTGTADSRGIESDGDLSQSTLGELPINRWYAYNATLIGRGKTETSGGLGVAWNSRDEDAANVANSAFINWNQGLRLDADGLYHYTNAPALGSIRNNLWDVNIAANTEGNFLFGGAFNNTMGAANVGGVSYIDNAVLDPRPQTGSALLSGTLAGAPSSVSYRGAFSGPTDNWADGWTALSKYGYLKEALQPVKPVIAVSGDIAAGTTVTWRKTNEYRLDTVIYVQTNATLIIEPGTVVKGATNVTIARDGIPELVSALWVTRGGKLIAEGTKDEPIILTAEGDNLDGNIPPTQSSLWGGVVLMGNAVINSAKDTAGNVANPKYDVYEGVTAAGPNNEHRFGGNNDADSSGSLRYVSIRHAGRIFAPAAELNCLTLAGVGSGTTIDYIEVFAGSDDGVEWWGGTVSANHVVAAFIEDDDFDTDQGYRGTNQFWFGIKPPWTGTADSRGIESDGDLSQSALGELPINRWYAYNATLIGRGKAETSGGLGVAWNTRDEDAANVANSLFANWNQGLRLDADGLYHYTNAVPLGSILNNVWDVNVQANTEGNFIFNTLGFSNTVGSAALGGISYTNDAALDPRPQSGSIALVNVLAGAPVSVAYRGAFSGPSDNWADGWTALSQYGYLKAATEGELNPPMLSSARTETGLRLTFFGQAGVLYRVETSLNLTAWSLQGGPSGSALGAGAEVNLNLNSSDVARFYRVRATQE
jgi:hypothetical protein